MLYFFFPNFNLSQFTKKLTPGLECVSSGRALAQKVEALSSIPCTGNEMGRERTPF
jgi:hypothetical protein